MFFMIEVMLANALFVRAAVTCELKIKVVGEDGSSLREVGAQRANYLASSHALRAY